MRTASQTGKEDLHSEEQRRGNCLLFAEVKPYGLVLHVRLLHTDLYPFGSLLPDTRAGTRGNQRTEKTFNGPSAHRHLNLPGSHKIAAHS